MPERAPNPPFASPPDQTQRARALDPTRSIVVQAPAGSGKTDLLTRRFLLLLGLADKPEEIVAITFTKAAAAEMRNRILSELEKAEARLRNTEGPPDPPDPLGLPALALTAMIRSNAQGWNLLDQPAQLRVTTIDSFCRSLALQSPLEWGLLSSLGGKLDPVDNASNLYRRAARRTIETLRDADAAARESVEALLLWRDNSWKGVEDLIVQMLGARNRWWQGFVFEREQDWDQLRARLEAPFQRAVRRELDSLGCLLDRLDESRAYALEMARLACETPGKSSPLNLAERVELPAAPFPDGLADARDAYTELAGFLLTRDGSWRKPGGLNVHGGFPATPSGKRNKQIFGEFLDSLAQEPGLEAALAAFLAPMPHAYTDDEWTLVRHGFAVLREAAGQLQVVFSETGSVDFVQVAQIAQRILAETDGSPSDFALQVGDGIRHLLVDEFQDTSRSQHQLLSRLIAAWPQREGRSCFCVGDPMQSIYGFREAEVELFERLKSHGLETETDAPLLFDPVRLTANFRTAPSLVADLNRRFARIFAEDDGSGVRFASADPMRPPLSNATAELHLRFTLNRVPDDPSAPGNPDQTRATQLAEIVSLIRSELAKADLVRAAGNPEAQYRIAVLGRTKRSVVAVAAALREANIGYRAIELVPLRERPEVVDVLTLARALLNPVDRTAWLGVLRAPWCGLSLAELHLLTSADDLAIRATPIPELLKTRLPALVSAGQLEIRAAGAAERVGRAMRQAAELRAGAASLALGSWIELVWRALGGEDTVDAEQRENLRLLWACLDKLPNGELDLLASGPDAGLNAALDKLFAQPDPATSSRFGVQLMTIHKSKGLEFEVVIVPELEAPVRRGEQAMFTWLERGLADSDGGDVSEFLIAPIQPKGEDAGHAKRWVDAVKRKRETQEMRRLLYVAATRAREALHLFARPRFSIDKSGEYKLATPAGNLLATAWPAVEAEVTGRFADWLATLPGQAVAQTLEDVAASAALLQMPEPAKPTLVLRLPSDYRAPEFPRLPADSQVSSTAEPLFARTEGGLLARLEGSAIHSLLERLARLRQRLSPEEAANELASSLPGVAAQVRAAGLPADAAKKLAGRALAVVRLAATDPDGVWITAPHPQAASETAWTGVFTDNVGHRQQRSLRPDRVFLASDPTQPAGEPLWWIVDYKSSHAPDSTHSEATGKASFLARHRKLYGEQLQTYAQVLRALHPESRTIRAGLYYPRLPLFDFWEL